MRAWLRALGIGAVLVASPPALGQAPSSSDGSARLFAYEADVLVSAAPALVRLPLPAEVLSSCRADLGDLRVYDTRGHELPFVVDASGPSDRPRERELVRTRQTNVDRILETPEGRPPSVREVYEIVPMTEARSEEAANGGEPSPSLSWSLAIRSTGKYFVRHVTVSHRAADGSLETRVERAPLFRIEGGSRVDRVPLPGPPEALVVEITGREDFYLSPNFSFLGEPAETRAEPVLLEVPLERVALESAEGRTRLDLARPSGLVPDALRVATSTPAFSRPVTAFDVRHGERETPIGSRRLFRAPLDPTIEGLELPVEVSAGDRLRLEIEDDGLPPLESLAVSAVLRQPSLVFFAPAPPAEGGAVAVLRFGGGRAERPRYDFADLWPDTRRPGPGREAMLRAAPASLGETRTNPHYDDAPALAFAQQPGAAIDPRLWARRRSVSVPLAPDGLVRLALDLDDVAAARPDLADLRVVDGDDRQWPYLLEADAVRSWRALPAPAPATKDGWSRYALALPVTPVRVDGLEIVPDTGFVERRYRVVATDDGGAERTLAEGAFHARSERPASLDVAFPPARASALALEVEDGDEAPLALRSLRARFVLPELYLVAPEGEYALLVGQPEAAAPSYALARVRDVVLAVSATPASAGPLGGNPVYEASARLAAGGLASGLGARLAVWIALAAAVAVLAVVTLRLVRRETGAASNQEDRR